MDMDDDYMELYKMGEIYLEKEDYEKAINIYSEAIELNPRDSVAYNNRGYAYYCQRKYEKALSDYNKALELNSRDSIAYNNRGNVYLNKGNYEKALSDYNKSIEFDSSYEKPYNGRGFLYNEEGKYEKALVDYNKAIELNPNYIDAYNNRGNTYTNKKDYEKALSDYDKVLEFSSEYAEGYNNRGYAYACKGMYEKALSDYNRALELNPDYIEAYNNRAEIYISIGEKEKALSDYNKAIELNPSYIELYINRGKLYQELGKKKEALEDYNEVIHLDPSKKEDIEKYKRDIRIDKESEMYRKENLDLNNRITKPIDSNSTSKDYLNREHISNAISLYIRTKKESISTIGVFSTWGNGKSSFIKNILEKLKEEPARNEVEILPIEIDAVFSDDCEKIWIIIYKKLIQEYKNQISNCRLIQNFLKLIFHLCSIGILYLLFPLLSIKPLLVYGYIFLLVYSVLFLLFIEFKKYYKWLNNLSLKIQDFLLETIVYFKLFYKPTIILIANLIMFFMLKSDFINYTKKITFGNIKINKGTLITGIISTIWIFCDFTKNIVSVLNKESFISAYKHEEKLGFKSVIHEKINNVIEKIIDGKDRKILIIVDELDRSSLDKINEIIESTHILLNNNNLIFLFSVNPRQIGKALLIKEKESLNNEIDIYKYGRHYIEKYMDVYLYLPSNTNYDQFLSNLIEESELQKRVESKFNESPVIEMNSTSTLKALGRVEKRMSFFKRKTIQFAKDEKQEIKITINKITEYSNLTPRKVKTIITLSTLSVQIFNSRRGGTIRKERLSLMKFILINLGLLDFMDMSEILKYEGSTYYKFLEKVISKTEKTNNDELVKDIDIDFIDSYGKEYLSLFAEKLDFN